MKKIRIEKSMHDIPSPDKMETLWVRFMSFNRPGGPHHDEATNILEEAGGRNGYGHAGSFPADKIDAVAANFRRAGWNVEYDSKLMTERRKEGIESEKNH